MAIYSLNISGVSRDKGHSPVAGSAYRACEKIEDRTTGEVHDYRNKSGLMFEHITAPQAVDVPEWTLDRAELWNGLQESNKRVNATLAREITLALPHELSHSERAALATEYAQWIADRHQVMVDTVIHAPDKGGDDRNYHAHMMMTANQITEDGFKKTKSHNKVRFIAFDEKRQNLGSKETIIFREKAAELSNAALQNAEHSERVDHRSYADQGIGKAPTVHLGKEANQLKQKGNVNDLRLVVINEERTRQNHIYDALNHHHTLEAHVKALPANDDRAPLPAVDVEPTPEKPVSLEALQAERAAIQEEIARITAHTPQNAPQEAPEHSQGGFLHEMVQRVVSVAYWMRENATELYQRFAEQEEEERQTAQETEAASIYPQQHDLQAEWEQELQESNEREQSL